MLPGGVIFSPEKIILSLGKNGKHVNATDMLQGNRVKIPDSTRCCESHILLNIVVATGFFYVPGRRSKGDKSEDLPFMFNYL